MKIRKVCNALVTTIVFALAIAMMTGCAHQYIKLANTLCYQQLSSWFPDLSENHVKSLCNKVVSLGYDTASEMCLTQCLELTNDDQAFCKDMCTQDGVPKHLNLNNVPSISEIGNASSEAQINFVTDY